MRISILVMIATLMALVALPAAAGLVNGTFNQGLVAPTAATTTNLTTALTGWTYSLSTTPLSNWFIGYNNGWWNQVVPVNPAPPGAGVGSVFHTSPTGKTANVQQSVAGMLAGKRYEVGVWLCPPRPAGKPGGATLTLGVQNPEAPGWTWSAVCGDDEAEKNVWSYYSAQVTASSTGAVDIRIYITMGDGGWTQKTTPQACWDDMTMTVPEPGSMIALLSGLVGLVGFAVRRRK